MAKIVELIVTDEKTGAGTEENPVRRCIQLWSKEGELVAQYDPTTNKITGSVAWWTQR